MAFVMHVNDGMPIVNYSFIGVISNLVNLVLEVSQGDAFKVDTKETEIVSEIVIVRNLEHERIVPGFA